MTELKTLAAAIAANADLLERQRGVPFSIAEKITNIAERLDELADEIQVNHEAQEENAELQAQVEQLQQDLSAEQEMVSNYHDTNSALAAQVEQLQQRNNELEVMQPSYNLIRNAFYDGACWFDGTINNGTLALDKAANGYANEKLAELTPAQCSAEIKAQAVEDAVRNTHTHRIHGEVRLYHCQSALLQYANQLRQQAKGE